MAVDQNWRYTPPFQSEFDLQQAAFNIATFGGRTRMAALRGDNVKVPYRHGTIWTPKYYDEQKLTLAMWVIGANPTTGVPDTDPQAKMWSNLATLERVFSMGHLQQGVLKKLHPVQNKDVVAEAVVEGVVDFTTEAGATRAAFTVDFVLPKVWFEDPALLGETVFTSRAHNATWSIAIDSDVPMDAIVSFRAAAGTPSNPKLLNTSLSAANHWVQLNDVFATSDEIVINPTLWTAVKNGTLVVTNNVRWSGQPQFFQLLPGTNNLKLEVTNGPIEVKVQAKGRYW